MNKFVYRNENGKITVEADGEMLEMASEVGHLAYTLYSAYSHKDPALGESFKDMVLTLMNGEKSPVWKVRENKPGDLEILYNK